MNVRIEQSSSLREEIERTSALDNPEERELLEEIGFRPPKADTDAAGDSEPDEGNDLTPHDEILIDGGQFTPAMIRRSH